MNKTKTFWKSVAFGLLLPIVVACTPFTVETEPTLVVPTAIVDAALEDVPTATIAPTSTLAPTLVPTLVSTTVPTTVPTLAATATPIPVEPTTEPDTHTGPAATATAMAAQTTPLPSADNNAYQVAFVTTDDTLNVRAGAGVDYDVVGELAANEASVAITGSGEVVAGSTWVPIRAGEVEGWVNGRFLTPMQPEAAFCDDDAVMTLVEGFRTAVSNRDGEALAQLIDAERGLRIRVSWWNPEIRLAQDELVDIFESDTSYDWGIYDGSGDARVGTFATQIVPMFDNDLLPASEIGCNELLNGGSAGWVKLPDEYEPLNFVTFYRPHGPDQIEMDWGSWAIGVEKWGDSYKISYLVHFAWEI